MRLSPLTTANANTMAERKAVIKNADMSEDMQQDAVDCASQALEKYNIEKDIAAFIKKEFDKKYNPTWHCIVGRNFGSCTRPRPPPRPRRSARLPLPGRQRSPRRGRAPLPRRARRAARCSPALRPRRRVADVTHETKHFIYFYLGQVAILLFKSG